LAPLFHVLTLVFFILLSFSMGVVSVGFLGAAVSRCHTGFLYLTFFFLKESKGLFYIKRKRIFFLHSLLAFLL